ncbi:Uncharacterized membrane protein [Halorubrum aquaticum]|uniref:Uncharacterized membrane protein n=1 Tax=Halorubrum aquaticum TaxID=387340 RepID=A0A1I2Z4H1_9EURY|nr:hypothetical protein [Halorubrum aquaticum]SFH32475.1 Uncharacterized membrane protein [Halorubrum aquaticum]
MVTDRSTAGDAVDAVVEDTTDDSLTGEEPMDSEATSGIGEAGTTEPETAATTADATTGTGLEPNVAGALSYLLGPITGVLFYVLEPEDAFVRFHAVQSTLVFGGLFVASLVLSVVLTLVSFVPGVGWIAAAVLGIGSLVLTPVAFLAWAFLMYEAYQGDEYVVPLVGSYARRYATVDE